MGRRRFTGLERSPPDDKRPADARNMLAIDAELRMRFGQRGDFLDRAVTWSELAAQRLVRLQSPLGAPLGTNEQVQQGDPIAVPSGPRIVKQGTVETGPTWTIPGGFGGGFIFSFQIDPEFLDSTVEGWVYSAIVRCTQLTRTAGAADRRYLVNMPAFPAVESQIVVSDAGAASGTIDLSIKRIVIHVDAWISIEGGGDVDAGDYTFENIVWWLLRMPSPG